MIICPDEKKQLILAQLEDLELYSVTNPEKDFTDLFFFDESPPLWKKFVPCLKKKNAPPEESQNDK